MMAADSPEGIMKLAQANGFNYIGFKPPLLEADRECLPLPIWNKQEMRDVPMVWEQFEDGTLDLAIKSDFFAEEGKEDDQRETFVRYAGRIAKYFGDYSIDPVVRLLIHDSVIAQSEGIHQSRTLIPH
jgi:hypothetical protein